MMYLWRISMPPERHRDVEHPQALSASHLGSSLGKTMTAVCCYALDIQYSIIICMYPLYNSCGVFTAARLCYALYTVSGLFFCFFTCFCPMPCSLCSCFLGSRSRGGYTQQHHPKHQNSHASTQTQRASERNRI